MLGEHHYTLTATWTGDRGSGTTGYREYDRDVTLSVKGKSDVFASADVPFRGDGSRWNPEDLLVASLVECHLLSYLHACVEVGVVVTAYSDEATATMREHGKASGAFLEVVLHPIVTVSDATMVDAALAAHTTAHERCFIANSVNFPVRHEPKIIVY